MTKVHICRIGALATGGPGAAVNLPDGVQGGLQFWAFKAITDAINNKFPQSTSFLISNCVQKGNPSDDKSLIIVLFVSGPEQRKKAGNENQIWQNILLLFLGCRCFELGDMGTVKLLVLHHNQINSSCLCSLCLA